MRRAARYLTLLAPLLVVLCLSKVHAAWVADPPYDYTGSFRFGWSLGYALLLTLAAYGAGLPDIPRGTRAALAAAAGASVGAALLVSAVQLLVGDALLPRFVVFGAAILLVPIHGVAAAMARTGRSRDEGRDRVMLVGSAEEADRLTADLARSPEKPAELVAHLLPPDAIADQDLARPVVEAVIAERATVVVLDRDALLDETVIGQVAALHESGVRVRSLLQFYEEWLGKLPLMELERASLFFDISEIHWVRYGRVKRMVDLFIGVLGLVLLGLAVPFVLVGNAVANRGSLLYRQVRVGRDGRTFEILKFRTMRPAGPDGPVEGEWTAVDDPRITRFGGFLRTTHLDELPQMWNIVSGELSVVGPRPEQPRYVRELSENLPFYGMRHLVRPGLTGWAQVKYGYAGNQEDALEKLQYEFFYLGNQTLGFDLKVLGRTIRSVAGGNGAGR